MSSIQTSTLPDLIEYGKSLAISHGELHVKSFFIDSAGNKIIINYTSIMDRYFDLLNEYIVDVELTDEEFFKYRFQPKQLSMDLYNTLELWSLLLRINNLTSITQFTLTKLKVFDQNIISVINEILILEESNIKKNKDEVYK